MTRCATPRVNPRLVTDDRRFPLDAGSVMIGTRQAGVGKNQMPRVAITSELNPGPNCLLVFVDETGHEELAGNETIFAVGGCAILARGLKQGLHDPWREVRTIVNGDSEAPLHASDFTRDARPGHVEAIGAFFARPTFYRLAAVGSKATTYCDTLALAEVILAVLGRRIQEIVDRATPESVTVIFEHTERAEQIYEQYFSGIRFTCRGRDLPVDLCWMPKSANDPALEVSDFIMHAVRGQERQWLSGMQSEYRKDLAYPVNADTR